MLIEKKSILFLLAESVLKLSVNIPLKLQHWLSRILGDIASNVCTCRTSVRSTAHAFSERWKGLVGLFSLLFVSFKWRSSIQVPRWTHTKCKRVFQRHRLAIRPETFEFRSKNCSNCCVFSSRHVQRRLFRNYNDDGSARLDCRSAMQKFCRECRPDANRARRGTS